jgi:hypothetical protein
MLWKREVKAAKSSSWCDFNCPQMTFCYGRYALSWQACFTTESQGRWSAWRSLNERAEVSPYDTVAIEFRTLISTSNYTSVRDITETVSKSDY